MLDSVWQRVFHLETMQTVDVLKAEARRLRALAQKVEDLALELSEGSLGTTHQVTNAVANGRGEFSGLTQLQSVVKALEVYGAQTTRQIFERLNAGGQQIKRPTYITAMLPRLKDKIERTDGGKKIKLKESPPK